MIKPNIVLIVISAKSLPGTVGEMLYRSMKGMGTNDDSLIRIILAHSEVCDILFDLCLGVKTFALNA